MTDQELVLSHLEDLFEGEPHLAPRFYERFFERYPSAQELFGRHSHAAQNQMLHETIRAVIDHLDDSAWIRDYLEVMGERHHSYEVTLEMYDWWVECMLEVLEDLSADRWTRELAGAWERTLLYVSRTMREAGTGALAGKPEMARESGG